MMPTVAYLKLMLAVFFFGRVQKIRTGKNYRTSSTLPTSKFVPQGETPHILQPGCGYASILRLIILNRSFIY